MELDFPEKPMLSERRIMMPTERTLDKRGSSQVKKECKLFRTLASWISFSQDYYFWKTLGEPTSSAISGAHALTSSKRLDSIKSLYSSSNS